MYSELARHTEKLFYFFEIANEGSYHAAARKLGLTAPTLSYAIKQLEGVLNISLFNRSSKGITVTEAGEVLLGYCRKMFRELAATEQALHSNNSRAVERIRIGTYQSIAIYFWPNLREALEKNSTLSFSLVTNRSKNILESLVKQEIDIALTVGDFPQKGLISHELYKDQYAFYVSSKTSMSHLSQSKAATEQLMYVPDAMDESHRTLKQYLFGWDFGFREESEFDSFEVIADFVKRGYGIGILPLKVANNHGKGLKKIKIEGQPSINFGTHRFYLSYREDLDISQKSMASLLMAARSAVRLEIL